MREALGEAIARLPEREKLVVTLYYYEELTLREIGEVLGVTESRVSQLHTKAVLRLKARSRRRARDRELGRDSSRRDVRALAPAQDWAASLDSDRPRPEEERTRMAAIEPGKIRNVAVVGHRGTGKTSLVEALLFQTGEINRLGTIEAGTTVADWDEDEQKRQMSISLVARARRVAGPEDQPDRRAGRPELPGRGTIARCASSRARSSSSAA